MVLRTPMKKKDLVLVSKTGGFSAFFLFLQTLNNWQKEKKRRREKERDGGGEKWIELKI